MTSFQWEPTFLLSLSLARALSIPKQSENLEKPKMSCDHVTAAVHCCILQVTLLSWVETGILKAQYQAENTDTVLWSLDTSL